MSEKTVPATTGKEPIAREDTRGHECYLTPAVDIYETDEGLCVVADLPGVEKDDLQLRVDDSILTIEGRTRHTAPGEPLWGEYRLAHFFRQFELSEVVDQEKISADLKHGVLTVHLPKAEKARPRQVQVKVG